MHTLNVFHINFQQLHKPQEFFYISQKPLEYCFSSLFKIFNTGYITIIVFKPFDKISKKVYIFLSSVFTVEMIEASFIIMWNTNKIHAEHFKFSFSWGCFTW